jgi:hypothetical protein
MYCFLRATAINGKVSESRLAFTQRRLLNADGKGIRNPYETDFHFLGLLNGYLKWKNQLAKASWNRSPEKPDAGDRK